MLVSPCLQHKDSWNFETDPSKFRAISPDGDAEKGRSKLPVNVTCKDQGAGLNKYTWVFDRDQAAAIIQVRQKYPTQTNISLGKKQFNSPYLVLSSRMAAFLWTMVN
jgi:hypothetical protein